MPDQLLENDTVVWALQHALRSGSVGLSEVPGLVKRVISEDRWRERIVKVTGEIIHFEHFKEFVEEGPPDGLGGDIPTIMRLCADDKEAIDAIDRVTVGQLGGDHSKSNNIHLAPHGTSAQAAIRRLRKDRPDLHTRVLAHELSPHRAMLEAGFRPPTITVRIDDPAATAATLCRHLDRDSLCELHRALGRELAVLGVGV